MDRTHLLRRLTEVKRQVDHGEIMVDAQRRVIDSLIACGEDIAEAERLLEEFERAQERRSDEIDLLLEMLDKIPLAS